MEEASNNTSDTGKPSIFGTPGENAARTAALAAARRVIVPYGRHAFKTCGQVFADDPEYFRKTLGRQKHKSARLGAAIRLLLEEDDRRLREMVMGKRRAEGTGPRAE